MRRILHLHPKCGSGATTSLAGRRRCRLCHLCRMAIRKVRCQKSYTATPTSMHLESHASDAAYHLRRRATFWMPDLSMSTRVPSSRLASRKALRFHGRSGPGRTSSSVSYRVAAKCEPVSPMASSGPLSTAANRMAVWSAARVMGWGSYINLRDPLNLSILN